MRYLITVGKVLAPFVFGLVLAFYPVFLVLFTDKHTQSDYSIGLLFVGGAFTVMAGLTGLLMGSGRLPFMLTSPAILVLVAYSRTEPQQMLYHLAVLGTLVLGTAVGAVAGSRVRTLGRQREVVDYL